MKKKYFQYQKGGINSEWEFKDELEYPYIDLNYAEDFAREQLLKDGIKVAEFDDILPKKFKIEYRIDLELRDWGIKSLSASIIRISGDIRAEWMDKFPTSEYVTFDTNDFPDDITFISRFKGEEDKWLIKSEIDSKNHLIGEISVSFQPVYLNIDFKKKNIIVTFEIY